MFSFKCNLFSVDTDVTKQVSQSDVEEQSSHEISVTQQESEDLPKPVSTVKINKPAQPEVQSCQLTLLPLKSECLMSAGQDGLLACFHNVTQFWE